jgi:hypothetical protein
MVSIAFLARTEVSPSYSWQLTRASRTSFLGNCSGLAGAQSNEIPVPHQHEHRQGGSAIAEPSSNSMQLASGHTSGTSLSDVRKGDALDVAWCHLG